VENTIVPQLLGVVRRTRPRRPRARGARSYFLNIKGPELLNKYVDETERHIRLVFQRARRSRQHPGSGTADDGGRVRAAGAPGRSGAGRRMIQRVITRSR